YTSASAGSGWPSLLFTSHPSADGRTGMVNLGGSNVYLAPIATTTAGTVVGTWAVGQSAGSTQTHKAIWAVDVSDALVGGGTAASRAAVWPYAPGTPNAEGADLLLDITDWLANTPGPAPTISATLTATPEGSLAGHATQ